MYDQQTIRKLYPGVKSVRFASGGISFESGEGAVVFDPPLIHSADIDMSSSNRDGAVYYENGVPHLISDKARRRDL